MHLSTFPPFHLPTFYSHLKRLKDLLGLVQNFCRLETIGKPIHDAMELRINFAAGPSHLEIFQDMNRFSCEFGLHPPDFFFISNEDLPFFGKDGPWSWETLLLKVPSHGEKILADRRACQDRMEALDDIATCRCVELIGLVYKPIGHSFRAANFPDIIRGDDSGGNLDSRI